MNHSNPRAHVRDELGAYVEGDLPLPERSRVDEHLSQCASCREELHELRVTVALLRGMPDPEPPPYLATRVMARIEAGEGRREGLPRWLERLLRPPVAVVVAAAAATVFFYGGTTSQTPVEPFTITAGVAPRAVPPPVRVRIPRTDSLGETALAFFGPANPDAPMAAMREDPTSLLDRIVLGRDTGTYELDRQLRALIDDPNSYLERMGAVSRPELLVDRLAARAARRGVAPDVAMRVTSSGHPMGQAVSARFLAAALMPERFEERARRSNPRREPAVLPVSHAIYGR